MEGETGEIRPFSRSSRRSWKALREAGETGDRDLHRSGWPEILEGAQGSQGDGRDPSVQSVQPEILEGAQGSQGDGRDPSGQSVQPEILEGAQGGRGDRRPRPPPERLAGDPGRRSGRPGRPATEVSIGAAGRAVTVETKKPTAEAAGSGVLVRCDRWA